MNIGNRINIMIRRVQFLKFAQQRRVALDYQMAFDEIEGMLSSILMPFWKWEDYEWRVANKFYIEGEALPSSETLG